MIMAVDIFLKLGDVAGESQDSAHVGEIDVLAWSWGMSQSGTMHTGGGGGAGKVSIQDLSITKWVDKASPNMMMACSTGSQYPEATLTVRKSGGDVPLEYVVMTMSDVIVTSLSTGGSGGEDRLTENVTLNFAKVKVDYQPQKQDGSKDGGEVTYNWDIAANVKV